MTPIEDLRTLFDDLTQLGAPAPGSDIFPSAILTGSNWQPAGSLLKVTFPAGSYLTHMGQPVERILVHLSGDVSVNKYSRQGQGIHDTVSTPPQNG